MKIKKKQIKRVESQLRVFIDLDVEQAKNLNSQLFKLLKDNEEVMFLDEVRELNQSLCDSLDERQLY